MLLAKLTENGGAKLETCCDSLIGKAMEGDPNAMKIILERVEGKIPQTIVGDQGNPVIVEHTAAREFIARRILGAAAENTGSEDPVGHDGSAER
jgi:hypothetical protein